ncbi:MAG: SDR family NAD(P)-dependent oxidoreductase, partial [Planctomycetaceae bacterium]
MSQADASHPAPPTVGQLFDLSGRVALITGARGHLGRAMAQALAEAGARVVVSSRDEFMARQVADDLGGAAAGRHLGVRIDQLDAGFWDHRSAMEGRDGLFRDVLRDEPCDVGVERVLADAIEVE